MIKIENTVFVNANQMEFIIQGMRNPWDKSDSEIKYESWHDMSGGKYEIGPNDYELIQHLSTAGPDHRKFMRMMPVYAQITAPLYWWKEFDTYKVGTVANSCSTMHKIQEKEFTLEDFSCEHLIGYESFAFPLGGGWRGLDAIEVLDCTIEALNNARTRYLVTKDKKYWWQMIQLLPNSYNQRRTVMLNYEVLLNIYKSYKNHRLDEWRDFCKWIESLPYSEVIIGIQNEDASLSQPIKEQEMINVYGQLIPKKDIENHGNYNNAVFNGEN